MMDPAKSPRGIPPHSGRHYARVRSMVLLAQCLLLGCASGPAAGRPPAAESGRPSATPVPSPTATPSPSPTPARIDFALRIRPILEEKCAPCHFPGGRMYDRMPFDRESTVRTLGEAMFTRLRDAEDQDLLRTFLAQPPEEKEP